MFGSKRKGRGKLAMKSSSQLRVLKRKKNIKGKTPAGGRGAP